MDSQHNSQNQTTIISVTYGSQVDTAHPQSGDSPNLLFLSYLVLIAFFALLGKRSKR